MKRTFHPLCLLCRFFLSYVAGVMALSGADSLATAASMVGTGLGQDVAGWVSKRREFRQIYWSSGLGLNLANHVYVKSRQKRLAGLIVSLVAICLIHGVLWVALTGLGSIQPSSALILSHVDSGFIVRISHIARTY
jgi:hypothetical protein